MKKLTIKSWATEDRPREKLSLKGKEMLSDAELLAILIGSGNTTKSAVELSRHILASYNFSLNNLSEMDSEELTKFQGIGEAKACAIITAFELGRRCSFEKKVKKEKITCSNDVFDLMQPVIGNLKHEEFWVLYLNNSNKVLHRLQLSKGGLTGTVVDVRLLLKKALDLLATAIILCHNHPSGNLKPSTADKNITQKLRIASETMDIKVLDHLIVTEKTYFSFADENEM